MGADYFLAYLGVRYTFEPDDDDECKELELLEVNELEDGELEDGDIEELQKYPHFAAALKAKQVGLKFWTGRLTNGEYFFLFIGTELGVFGLEGESYKSIQVPELLKLIEATRGKLRRIGITEEPALHLQLEAQY